MSLWRNSLRNSRLLELLRSQPDVVVGEVDLANGTLVAFVEEAEEVVEDVPDDQTTMLVSAALGALAAVVVTSAAAYWCLRRRYPVIAQRVEDRVVDWVGRSGGALRGFCQVVNRSQFTRHEVNTRGGVTVHHSEMISVESWSTDSSLYPSSESDYCTIMDPRPAADMPTQECLIISPVVQSTVQMTGPERENVEGRSLVAANGVAPEVSDQGEDDDSSEDTEVEDIVATVDDAVLEGLQPFIPALHSSPVQQDAGEQVLRQEGCENLEPMSINPIRAAVIPDQWRSVEAMDLQVQLVQELSASSQDFGIRSLFMEPEESAATAEDREVELILNSSKPVNLPDLPESELEDTFILSGDESNSSQSSRGISLSGSSLRRERSHGRHSSSVVAIDIHPDEGFRLNPSEEVEESIQVAPGINSEVATGYPERPPPLRRSLRRSIMPDRFQPY